MTESDDEKSAAEVSGMPAGERGRTTIWQVARTAGVGIATVSRVLSGNASVAEPLRVRVETAARELNYRPNQAARTMRGGASTTIACAIGGTSIPEFGAFVHAAERVFRKHGFTVILLNTEADLDVELECLATLHSLHIAGLLLATVTQDSREREEALRRLNVPVVYIDRPVVGAHDAVCIDHAHGIQSATAYLLALGHSRIAMVTGRRGVRPTEERIAAYVKAHEQAGLTPDPELICTEPPSFGMENVFRTTSTLLRTPSPPTAVIAGGIAILPGVLRALRANGARVPETMSVIAGCGAEYLLDMNPAITAVTWDVQAWGRNSAELLLDRIQMHYRGPGREVLLPCELVIRDSCRVVEAVKLPGRKVAGQARRR